MYRPPQPPGHTPKALEPKPPQPPGHTPKALEPKPCTQIHYPGLSPILRPLLLLQDPKPITLILNEPAGHQQGRVRSVCLFGPFLRLESIRQSESGVQETLFSSLRHHNMRDPVLSSVSDRYAEPVTFVQLVCGLGLPSTSGGVRGDWPSKGGFGE
jgi:hypothetical protein